VGWPGLSFFYFCLLYLPLINGGVFFEPMISLRTCPARPIRDHTCSAITRRLCGVRLAGRKRHARFESSEALGELPAVARAAVDQPWTVELHECCARVSLAAALLNQHIDGVARAGSAGTKSGSSARSLVLLTMLVPVVENRTRFRDQLQLGDEANLSIIAVCDQSCRTDHLGRPGM
jgi:hypothetical protein